MEIAPRLACRASGLKALYSAEGSLYWAEGSLFGRGLFIELKALYSAEGSSLMSAVLSVVWIAATDDRFRISSPFNRFSASVS